MKKTIVLFRHGEAELESNLGDHGRKLTQFGEAQASKSFSALAKLDIKKPFFFLSDATRTTQTFLAGSSHFKTAASFKDRRFYLTGIEKMRLIINEIDNLEEFQSLVFVGHNPGLSLALATLAGDLTGLGTADAAVLSTEADNWNEALAMDGCWNVELIIRG
jgi:phosphohistidine phosphatase SixA